MPKKRVTKAASELKEILSVSQSKKSSSKNAPVKKSIKKRPTAAKMSPASPRKARSKNIPVKSENTTVILPPAPSLRLLEKVNLYKIWYQETLPLQATSSARFFGYLFIGLGTLFAASSNLLHKDLPTGVAALVCSTGICEEVAEESLPVGAPLIKFLNELPKEINSDRDFAVEVHNVTNFQIFLTNLLTGSKTELRPASTNSDLKFRVEVENLPWGDYKIEAITDDADVRYIFTGSIFSYKPIQKKPLETTATTTTNDSFVDIDGATSTPSETTELSSKISTQTPVSITYENTNEAAYLVVTTGDFVPERVDIYSRLPNTSSDVYLGQAYLVQNQWFFSLSAIELPEIKQQFFAKFVVDDAVKMTEAVEIDYKLVSATGTSTAEDLLIKKRKIDLSLLALELSNDDRTLYYTNKAAELKSETETQFVNEAIISEIDSVLERKIADLNTYFLNYAMAIQGGQLFAIDLAKGEILKAATEISYQVTEGFNDKTIAPAVETVLIDRFTKLILKVRTLEDKLAHETNTLIKQDTDSDGITDYDEITNSFTNPNEPDTDRDSVIDSVEIILRSDPLGANLEAYPDLGVPNFESINQKTISILKSRPLILESRARTPIQTQYSIEGKGIPGTFVYLLDKTNKTIGVIKTNQVGDFFYTIDRENVPNSSTVAAAIIGQNGEIVSISNLYPYTNQKPQLVAAVSDIFLDGEELSSRLTSFNILTGSIALVALGFILLLLAQSIKARKRSLVLKDLNFAAKA